MWGKFVEILFRVDRVIGFTPNYGRGGGLQFEGQRAGRSWPVGEEPPEWKVSARPDRYTEDIADLYVHSTN